MYEDKNEYDPPIPPDLWNIPTTQKALVNSIFSTRIYNDPDGSENYTQKILILHLGCL